MSVFGTRTTRLPTFDPEAEARRKYIAGEWTVEALELELDYLYGLKKRPFAKNDHVVYASAAVSAAVLPAVGSEAWKQGLMEQILADKRKLEEIR